MGNLVVRLIMATVRLLLRLPDPVLRMIAGRPVVVAGRQPLLTAQVLMRIAQFAPFDEPHRNGSLTRTRHELDLAGELSGRRIAPGVSTSDHRYDGPAGPLRLRRYEPAGAPALGPGLVYFHGGGFVLGSIETHDSTCRLLAEEAATRIISVEYRLAPEHPFPAAVNDALAAFRHIHATAATFGIDPDRLAVGGDSSGGNLAAVIAHAALRGEVPKPAFTMLLAPATDAKGETESHRLFSHGFRLDQDEWKWYRDRYLPDPADYENPRASVIYDDQVAGLPPTYIATCEFDLVRDEAEAYAQRLIDAGVHVIHRRHEGQIHGFPTRIGFDPDARSALIFAAAVLRTGLSQPGPTGRTPGLSRQAGPAWR